MRALDIPLLRLRGQQIVRPRLRTVAEVVAHMGAVQAQDYPGGKWAIGLRLVRGTDAAVEEAIARREIVRTWPMRGTLHFVAAADARWMVELLAARVIRGAASRYRALELDERAFRRGGEVIVKALEGGKRVHRRELHRLLSEAGFASPEARAHTIGYHAMRGSICFGPIEGKQHTFVLLDEWLPTARKLERDEALAELAARYFTSHGPAAESDFAWWSGLTLREVRAGVEGAGDRLVEETIGESRYWMAPTAAGRKVASPDVHLLPPFDEYTVAYRDRSAVLAPEFSGHAQRGGLFYPLVVIDGQVRGTWKRSGAAISLALFEAVTAVEREAIARVAEGYGGFLGMAVEVVGGE